jgi:hypothetical protein
VFFETLKVPSIELMERVVLIILPMHSEDWRTKILSFLQGNYPSDDEAYIKDACQNKAIYDYRRGIV